MLLALGSVTATATLSDSYTEGIRSLSVALTSYVLYT